MWVAVFFTVVSGWEYFSKNWEALKHLTKKEGLTSWNFQKAEIIAVGSELLLGQIANTNAQFISKQLAEIGVNVFYHTAVGDNPERLEASHPHC